MSENNTSKFKIACKNYFSTLRLSTLSCYGRFLQLKAPTAMKKDDLIESIIGVLCGEISPNRTCRGAPIKGNYVDQSIIATVSHFQKQYLDKDACKNDGNDTQITQSKNTVTFDNLEEKISSPVQCVVQLSKLNKEQKQLFLNFLESL